MGKETHSRRFGKNSVIPAKAGGRPAGMTEGCAIAGLMSLPTKYSDEPKKEILFFLAILTLITSNVVNARDNAWDSSPIGQCIKDFGTKIKRNEHDSDIKSVEVMQHGSINARYIWQWDDAPAKNQTRLLYKVSKKYEGCVILFLPFSDSHDFKLGKGNELPKKVSSLLSDSSVSYKIEYSLNEKT
jgi:hypothetical protein